MPNHADVDYAAITINDRNPVKRKLQNWRLNHGLKHFTSKPSATILDYGSGDGELCLRINKKAKESIIYSYEPSDNLRKQAQKKLKGIYNIEVLPSTQILQNNSMDYIFCLEVFEHLTLETILTELKEFKRLAKQDAKIIIGVPSEVYLAAFFKGALRLKRRHGENDAVFRNIIKAGLGFPPKKRELTDFDGMPYILRHMGFDYRKFKSILKDHFKIEKVYGSPIPGAPLLFNLEVYFVCSLGAG